MPILAPWLVTGVTDAETNRFDWSPHRVPDDDRRNDPLKHSRFKRMPKVWRLGQDAPRPADSLGDEFRVTVFLKNRQADRAERAAIDSGIGDLQAWCQTTLRSIIDRLDDDGPVPGTFYPVVRHKQPASAAEIEAALDIPDDPEFLREWAGIDDPPTPALPAPPLAELQGEWIEETETEVRTETPAPETSDPASLVPMIETVLAALREGRPPSEAEYTRLAAMIRGFSATLADAESLDRQAVRALYRLSMEAQVLITEVHPALGLDLRAVTAVRHLQAAVGEVLDR